MKRLLFLILSLAFFAPVALAADGDSLTCSRAEVRAGWGCQRYLVSDSDPNTGASTAFTPTLLGVKVPWDYARVWVDESDSCTSWTTEARDYPTTDTAQCEGACDAHVIATLSSTTNSSAIVDTPIGESFDANITAISSCTISMYADFYYRSQSK